MSQSAGRLIETKDLKKSFVVGKGTVDVLKGINITIDKGEFVIIFGPSGCGKSTLLHCLLGLEIPSSGSIVVDDHDFYHMADDERSLYRRHKVGMIYQQPLWISSCNVRDNVSFPLHLLDIDESVIEKKLQEVLGMVKLQEWADYMPTELSSGQQQKISLARALIIDPLLIVADEPTGNLDTVSGRELLETFLELVKQGKTIIMVTHDLEYLKYATKIFHMVDGEVVEEYEPKSGSKPLEFAGKKEINNNFMESNVRDPDFLKKLHL